MNTPRQSIAVDMDEVIADALTEHLARYNREFPGPTPLTSADLHGRWIWDAVPASRLAALERHILSDDFFAVLGVMPDAQRVLERLRSRYDIFIATAAMEIPTSFAAKFQWLARHFPFIPTSHIVFCGDKSILRTDFLIDDNPRQLERFEDLKGRELRGLQRGDCQGEEAEPKRQGILYTSPANINVTGYRRVHGWLDIEKLFLD